MEGCSVGGGKEGHTVRRVDHIGAAEPDRPRLYYRRSLRQTCQNALGRFRRFEAACHVLRQGPFLEGVGYPVLDRFRQPIEVKHAPDPDPFIVDAACRFGNSLILRHPRLAAKNRAKEGIRMLSEEHRWPPPRLSMLPEESHSEAETDGLMNELRVHWRPCNGDVNTPLSLNFCTVPLIEARSCLP